MTGIVQGHENQKGQIAEEVVESAALDGALQKLAGAASQLLSRAQGAAADEVAEASALVGGRERGNQVSATGHDDAIREFSEDELRKLERAAILDGQLVSNVDGKAVPKEIMELAPDLDIERYELASRIADAVLRLIPTNQPYPELWKAIVKEVDEILLMHEMDEADRQTAATPERQPSCLKKYDPPEFPDEELEAVVAGIEQRFPSDQVDSGGPEDEWSVDEWCDYESWER